MEFAGSPPPPSSAQQQQEAKNILASLYENDKFAFIMQYSRYDAHESAIVDDDELELLLLLLRFVVESKMFKVKLIPSWQTANDPSEDPVMT